MTSRTDSHPRFARFFRGVAPAMARGGLGDERPRLLAVEPEPLLRPAGQVRSIEHVRAEGALAAGIQQCLDATVWPRRFGGSHTGRDVLAAMAAAGFHLNRVVQLPHAATSTPFPARPQVTGLAVRPRDGDQP